MDCLKHLITDCDEGVPVTDLSEQPREDEIIAREC